MSIDPVTLSIIGSVASGIGSGMMAKSKQKAEERAQRETEKRREERYSGIGEAASVEDPSQAERQLGRQERQAQRVGSRPDRMGDRYSHDREAGLGRRPEPDNKPQAEIPSAVSVSQGAEPSLTEGGAAGVQPVASNQGTQPKPRYSYNPKTQRIDFAGTQQSQPAGLPPRPNTAGAM